MVKSLPEGTEEGSGQKCGSDKGKDDAQDHAEDAGANKHGQELCRQCREVYEGGKRPKMKTLRTKRGNKKSNSAENCRSLLAYVGGQR